jgi:hypothetical protein
MCIHVFKKISVVEIVTNCFMCGSIYSADSDLKSAISLKPICLEHIEPRLRNKQKMIRLLAASCNQSRFGNTDTYSDGKIYSERSPGVHPPHLLYKRGINPGLNPGFGVLRFGLSRWGISIALFSNCGNIDANLNIKSNNRKNAIMFFHSLTKFFL